MTVRAVEDSGPEFDPFNMANLVNLSESLSHASVSVQKDDGYANAYIHLVNAQNDIAYLRYEERVHGARFGDKHTVVHRSVLGLERAAKRSLAAILELAAPFTVEGEDVPEGTYTTAYISGQLAGAEMTALKLRQLVARL